MRIATPSFQSVSQPDQRMTRPEMTNPNGAMNSAAGNRYGRSASGRRRRKAPRDSGAPAYMSTLALVISPTSDCQLGNGRKQMQPITNAVTTPNQGTPRLLSRSKICGTYPLRDKP